MLSNVVDHGSKIFKVNEKKVVIIRNSKDDIENSLLDFAESQNSG